ncbi:MAG TPA: DUF6644 family protein [Steroidobacteraceae bacterium]|nr:DUF6644 family protein [Steroidobacteraceae bacterium]
MDSTIFQSIVHWMEQSWLGQMGRDTFWLFPLGEILHFFGLCLLMGAILVVDLRLLGFARRLSLQATLQLIPAAAFGLWINVVSGIIFLCAHPENYWPSWAFQLKLFAIFVGGLNALWFKWMEAPRLAKLPADGDADLRTKFVAATSISIWIAVITLGRFLPFVSKSSS